MAEATYQCRKCGNVFTVVFEPGPNDSDIVQPPEDGCPDCGQPVSPRDAID